MISRIPDIGPCKDDICVCSCRLSAALCRVSTTSPQEPLTLARAIELPHVEGRIDHLALDSTGERLFVAALGNNTVEVVDVKNGTHLKSLPGFREPKGIASRAGRPGDRGCERPGRRHPTDRRK